jgi:hypothetical protein
MRYEYEDNSLVENESFFNKSGYAFALKPENLRFIAETIEATEPNDPLLNFDVRVTETDYYSFQT